MESGQTPISLAVVEAVAAAEGVDPLDLPVPLATVVDTDALDALFRGKSGRVSFDYFGYRISVDSDRTVAVAPATEA